MHNLQSDMSCFCEAQDTLICHHHMYGCVVKADDGEDAEDDAKQQQEHMWTLHEEVVADCMHR